MLVAKATVTRCVLARDRVTAKFTTLLPVLPSATEMSLMERAGGLTVVTAMAVSSAGKISGSLRVTVARLVREPATSAVTVMVTVALVPAASVPRSQLITPSWLAQAPWDEARETKWMRPGRVLVSRTPVESAGPVFVTVRT